MVFLDDYIAKPFHSLFHRPDMPSLEASSAQSLDPSDRDGALVEASSSIAPEYRLYKRRFLGVIGLFVLNVVTGMAWPWFGPITNNMATEFGYTIDQVNWLGNITSVIYLPVALLVPAICARWNVRRCCDVGALCMIISAWVRYAGTVPGLSPGKSYAIVLIGQSFVSIAQPIFQVIGGPKYSEAWFDLEGRTTITMIISIANPVGGAIGQLISPLCGDVKRSILILGIISTAAAPFVLLVGSAPPTPPTYAGSQPEEPLSSLLREMVGLPTTKESRMTRQERIDFTILTLIFGVIAGATHSFSILTAEIMQPHGYSANESGLFGACLLLSGIVAAGVTAPLFDRIFAYRLAFMSKILVPIVAGSWFSLIWGVRNHDRAGLLAIMAIVGACSLTLLPIALELAVELTRSANASSAILWFVVNLFGIAFVLIQGALRSGPHTNPPHHMGKALIFNGVVIMVVSSLVFLVQGRQVRKERDEQELKERNGDFLPQPRVEPDERELKNESNSTESSTIIN